MYLHEKMYFPVIMILIFIMITVSNLTLLASDTDLGEKVRNALSREYTQNFTVNILEKGTVEIEGEVSSMYDKYQVFEIAARVDGVKKVITNVIVDTELLPDDVIENNIRDELDLVSAIKEPEKIKVIVDDGVAILSGEVSFYREKAMAKTVASWQEGVRGIVNNIEVKPLMKAMSDQNLQDILQSILEDDFPAEENITFTIDKGIVKLEGETSDLWAKQEIEERFSNIMGVVAVDNNILVTD